MDNLGMLVTSGMPLQSALAAIAKEAPPRVSRAITAIQGDVNNGEPLWRAFDKAAFLPSYVVALVRIGEESGKLPESLELIAAQMNKERDLRSKIRAAMLYPVFVLSLTAVVGLGIAWFILPKLTIVFSQLRVNLPFMTRVLIKFGAFLADYGAIAVPGFIVLALVIGYFLFFAKATKRVGQALVFMLPVTRRLVRETELARFGYLLGTLLKAGIPITQALDSLAAGAGFRPYQHLYTYLREHVEQGESLYASFTASSGSVRLIPMTVQQLIAAAEQSGKLPEALLRIGATYEAKTEITAKNLTVLLEPILLVIVWFGVLGVALAVILPIYSLLGGLST